MPKIYTHTQENRTTLKCIKLILMKQHYNSISCLSKHPSSENCSITTL